MGAKINRRDDGKEAKHIDEWHRAGGIHGEMVRLVAMFILVLLVQDAWSHTPSWVLEIDEYARAQLEKWSVPAASIAIVRDGGVIVTRGYGFRDLDRGLSADENTLYAIGSITKSFTAAAVGLLVERGQLQWETRIVDMIPDFRLFDDFATQRITSIDLLCHRSGLPDHNFVWYFTDFSRADLVRRLRFLQPSADFRTTFQYNPLMYNLAGYLVEQVSGVTWEEFTRRNLFGPLDMPRSNFSNEEYLADDNHAVPFTDREGVRVQVELHPSQTLSGPAGSINSTVVELAHWMIVQLAEGKFRDQQVLSAETVRRMQSPHMPLPSGHPPGEGPEGAVYSFASYGLGWIIGTYYDQIVVEHSGAIDGFASKMVMLPRLNAGVVILTNHQIEGDAFIYSMETRILAELMGREPFDGSSWLTGQRSDEPKPSTLRPAPVALERPAEDFVGIFTNPGYGDVVVGLGPAGLEMRYYRFEVDIVHQGDGVFRTHGGIVSRDVVFQESRTGTVDRLEIQWVRSIDPIVFERSDDNSSGR